MRQRSEPKDGSHRSLRRRFLDWLGLDRSESVDLLITDPPRHFHEWDRDLPDPYAG